MKKKNQDKCEHNFELSFFCNKYSKPKGSGNPRCMDTLFTDCPHGADKYDCLSSFLADVCSECGKVVVKEDK